MGVNNLPNVVTRLSGGRGSNSRPLSHKSDALATRLSSHTEIFISIFKQNFERKFLNKNFQCEQTLKGDIECHLELWLNIISPEKNLMWA